MYLPNFNHGPPLWGWGWRLGAMQPQLKTSQGNLSVICRKYSVTPQVGRSEPPLCVMVSCALSCPVY